jgi:hypothetical protein
MDLCVGLFFHFRLVLPLDRGEQEAGDFGLIGGSITVVWMSYLVETKEPCGDWQLGRRRKSSLRLIIAWQDLAKEIMWSSFVESWIQVVSPIAWRKSAVNRRNFAIRHNARLLLQLADCPTTIIKHLFLFQLQDSKTYWTLVVTMPLFHSNPLLGFLFGSSWIILDSVCSLPPHRFWRGWRGNSNLTRMARLGMVSY